MIDFAAAALAGAAVAGGKGWNLGRLWRYGFAVPQGGVIAAAVYRSLLESPALRPLTAAVADMAAEQVLEPWAADRMDAVRAAILAYPLPASVLDGALLSPGAVAVRSSATLEDGESASFAGIHESYLDVVGPEAVLEAVKRCFASLWTPRAVAYRRRLGIGDEQLACAVVICEMVNARAAGVAFTCDPRTGRRDRVVISAAPGVGEALVSGHVTAEEITVEQGVVTARGGRPDQVLTDADAAALAGVTTFLLDI